MSPTINQLSLRWKLAWMFALTAVLTVVPFGVLAYRAAAASTLNATQTRLHSAIAEINTLNEASLAAQLETFRSVARDPSIAAALQAPDQPLSPAASAAMKRLQAGPADSPVIVELVGTDGIVRHRLPADASTAEIEPSLNFSAEPVISPRYARADNQFFQTTIAVRGDNTALGGIRATRRAAKIGSSRRVIANLLGADAELLVGNNDGTMWDEGGALHYPIAAGQSGVYSHSGKSWVSSSTAVSHTPWIYAVEVPERAALAPVRALLIPFIGMGAVVAVIAALIGLRVSRQFTKPLEELTAASEAIAKGQRDAPLSATSRGDEIGRLARSFGVMATNVRGVRDRLESEVDVRTGQLRSAVDRLRDLDAELQRNQHLATLGQMSGSIGHELRNPLGVMSSVVLLLDNLPDATPKLKDYARLLREQIRLSDRIISDLLDRTRAKTPVKSSVDITALLDELLTRTEAPSTVRIERRFSIDLPPVVVDRDHVGQIVWNLVTNAVQALNGSPGTVSVSTAKHDGRVRIEVSDTGPGVSVADVDRIFEPLYTTKAQGVGLGLSLSRAFARANGGELFVLTQDTPGACFVLDLPLAAA